ncbi:MAG TPA: 4-(cytidine 5'-diphospho)-2-C-methyl-D-erythritol kinase [Gemmatimonadaceae bacterium]|nr:4-(cytidine 5'-diphospho)-2-C-methyl-D-erythritol kinase [Gemmatimonadaceae bacterium]
MSGRVARVAAHAKLNLFLRVLARERDGYHSIETLFARIALADDVTVHVDTRDRTIDCGRADVGPPAQNLAFRAAEAFRAATGWPEGFHIEIVKRIPAGGGLGGGSADAGAVLRALAALAPEPVSGEALLRMAMPLGSDVPFLTTTAPWALAWGRGERLLAIAPLKARPVVLALPPFAVSTASAYEWLAATRTYGTREPALLTLKALHSWEHLAALATNDFEPVVCERHPQIATLIAHLRRAGSACATISGSGSTVFGLFAAAPESELLQRTLDVPVIPTQTLEQVEPVDVMV